MTRQEHLWTIVLAGGSGSRLRHLTSAGDGPSIPKQYCSVNGGPSLVRQSLNRARSLSGAERTVVVVSAEHRRWWSKEVGGLPTRNIIVQPCNRGTACGLMLPTMQILPRDPDATVVVLPSDHVVADEQMLIDSIALAAAQADEAPERLVMLGMSPDRADTELGWIEPRFNETDHVHGVQQFVEKPSRGQAELLLREGALWNSFIFAVRAAHLIDLFHEVLPWMARMFTYTLMQEKGRSSLSDRVSRLYERLPKVDFSRAILQEIAPSMDVVAVPPCGWGDVGTVDRLARCAARCSPKDATRIAECRSGAGATVDLVDALDAYLMNSGAKETD